MNEIRTEFGRRLARETGVDADVVVPIPDSGVCAAIGISEASDIPMRMGLIRNHYVGRTFIEPQQSIRHFGVRVKLNPVRSILEGKRVVLVDDSIVRGTTSRKIVRMVRGAGAREVHMRISCPPTISPCFYGVDTPRRTELIAATQRSRRYAAPRRGQHRVFESRWADRRRRRRRRYCTSCYTGFTLSRSRGTKRLTCSLRSSSTPSQSRSNPSTSCSRRWKRIQSRASSVSSRFCDRDSHGRLGNPHCRSAKQRSCEQSKKQHRHTFSLLTIPRG